MMVQVVLCVVSGGMQALRQIMRGEGENVLWPQTEWMKRRWMHIVGSSVLLKRATRWSCATREVGYDCADRVLMFLFVPSSWN